jgi:hypothetical protein
MYDLASYADFKANPERALWFHEKNLLPANLSEFTN